MILDGKIISGEILNFLKKEVESLSFQPIFCDVLVGTDSVSKKYAYMKMKKAESIGVKVHTAEFSYNIKTEELVKEINLISKIENMCGIIVQLPLPKHINTEKVLDSIPPIIDVDATGNINSELFYENMPRYIFPTAGAVMELLAHIDISLLDKNVVVVGRGALVGRPVAHLLKQKGASVTVVRRDTKNVEEIFKSADILISAVGHSNLITGDVIKNGAIVIDAGTSESRGAVVGDIEIESVLQKASWVSPVPGGVGPITVAKLLENVVLSARNLTNK